MLLSNFVYLKSLQPAGDVEKSDSQCTPIINLSSKLIANNDSPDTSEELTEAAQSLQFTDAQLQGVLQVNRMNEAVKNKKSISDCDVKSVVRRT